MKSNGRIDRFRWTALLFSLLVGAVPARSQTAPTALPQITRTGVGPFHPGTTIPRDLLDTNRKPKEIYHAEYYADAQPLEGFSFSSPPVFVVLKNGPFHRWGMEHPGQQPPDRIRDTTIAYARGGRLLISMLVITDPRLQTKEGVSVGADYADVQAMYPHAIITPLPSLWEEPTCALREQGLTFFFKGCEFHPGSSVKPVPNARLIRITVANTPTAK